MIDPRASPFFLDETSGTVPAPPPALRAYLALVAAVGAAGTALLLMMSVAANSGIEAERIAETRGDGYAGTLAAALAVNLSKPLR